MLRNEIFNKWALEVANQEYAGKLEEVVNLG